MFKLINPNSSYFTEDLLTAIARNRGIMNLDFIKNPNKDATIHYSKLKNIDKVTDAIVHFGKKESSEVGIVVDSDA